MTIKAFTLEQTQEITKRLNLLARSKVFCEKKLRVHSAGMGYTSLMVCFSSHIMASIETLLFLYKQFGKEWFPSTVGFIILRSMFEIDIQAHYISEEPKERAGTYINFGSIINKRKYEALLRHRNEVHGNWKEMCETVLAKVYSAEKLNKIMDAFEKNKINYEYTDKSGKKRLYSNWTNKSLR